MALVNLFSLHYLFAEGIEDHLQILLHYGHNYAS